MHQSAQQATATPLAYGLLTTVTFPTETRIYMKDQDPPPKNTGYVGAAGLQASAQEEEGREPPAGPHMPRVGLTGAPGTQAVAGM